MSGWVTDSIGRNMIVLVEDRVAKRIGYRDLCDLFARSIGIGVRKGDIVPEPVGNGDDAPILIEILCAPVLIFEMVAGARITARALIKEHVLQLIPLSRRFVKGSFYNAIIKA